MLDFLIVSTRSPKRGIIEVYPKLIIKHSEDLMIRGGDFYAIWNEDTKLWSTSEEVALYLIDREVDKYVKENLSNSTDVIKVLHMWDADSGMIDKWHKYVQKQMRDSYHMLDEKLIFSNVDTKKTDYASKKLKYPIEKSDIPAYEELISTLYSPDERKKIEWAIGAIVSGHSVNIQKFIVMYGSAGTGKSTVLNIIQDLFEGYYSVFDAKALGSANNSFALEAFKTNPLVAIQHDGDLSRIEDNTRINSIVSHELMTVNEKFKSAYTNRFNAFLFMGTNKPVKITDAKSGILRRLIDVSPSGNKVDSERYKTLVNQIKFELGGIASHCKDLYLSDPDAYDGYVPISMMGASNDFYNFILDSYDVFKNSEGTTLKSAWELYKNYCEDAKLSYPLNLRTFKEELKNYFKSFEDRATLDDDTRVRNWYSGFIFDKFEYKTSEKRTKKKSNKLVLDSEESIFDIACRDCFAQYASSKETPSKKWDDVDTKLSDIDTSKIHYVRVPENHIVIDFDIKDEKGNKSMELNLEAASKWPPTYAEFSKGGSGVHLHYIYNGDVSELSRVFDENIEVKVFNGNSSLRRKLTKCNNLPIANISSGLPLKTKGDTKVVNFDVIKNEKGIRTMILKNLNKEIHPGTKPSIDFIYKILEDAYNDGIVYDVTNLKSSVIAFAAQSSHQADYCLKLVNKMKFKSETDSESSDKYKDDTLIFYDIEVFPNLFLVNWKRKGADKVVRMINPTPEEIEELCKFKLVGFNCRRYDNHILHARIMKYTNEQLYNLSQRIISGDKNAFFQSAYDISYTDVYDFASAGNKKSLKKLEIEMGIHHQELGLPWDKPVPEELWEKVAEYCDNDVIATEAAFDYLSADWTARQILADLACMSVNDTTNSLTTKIIFGSDRNPQSQFNYRDLSKPVYELDEDTEKFLKDIFPEMMSQRHGEENSLLPYFPGYKFDHGKSIYRDEEVGEGGYVYAEPGIYGNVALLDIASMHPHSVLAECLFGKYTREFYDIVYGRVNIKHEDWERVNKMLNGKLTPYVQKVINGEMSSKQLANALKTAINSVYGLTSASFDNPFRDPRNIDNIVAKRGALFMIDLKHEVQKRGYTVAHIKTDSIKIPDADENIINFVMEFGKKYGYSFEHEATYEKLCLVNDAVYIAKDKSDGHWTATGTQFQVPYVFKTLFSKEEITFDDLCETKSASTSLYLDFNENMEDIAPYEKEYERLLKEFGKQASLSQNNPPTKSMTITYLENWFNATLDDNLALEDIDPNLVQNIIDIREKMNSLHNYTFIGKVGRFCPMKPGTGGGILYREKDGKYYAAGGTKGYRWKESEIVRTLNQDKDIDKSYYNELVDAAIASIDQYGDFERFVNEPYHEPPFTGGKALKTA